MLSPTQHTHLHTLINGNEGELDNPNNPLTGAILTITKPNGDVAYRAPLARMWRHEPDEPTIWLRPITTTPDPTQPISKTNGFPLATNRRRSISYTTVAITDSGAVRFHTTENQYAIIDTVRDRVHAEQLQAWDTFTLVTLPDDIVDALEQLDEDGWYDEWA